MFRITINLFFIGIFVPCIFLCSSRIIGWAHDWDEKNKNWKKEYCVELSRVTRSSERRVILHTLSSRYSHTPSSLKGRKKKKGLPAPECIAILRCERDLNLGSAWRVVKPLWERKTLGGTTPTSCAFFVARVTYLACLAGFSYHAQHFFLSISSVRSR